MLGDAGARGAETKFRVLYFGADLRLIAALQQVLTKPSYQLITSSNYDDAVLFLRSRIPYDLLTAFGPCSFERVLATFILPVKIVALVPASSFRILIEKFTRPTVVMLLSST